MNAYGVFNRIILSSGFGVFLIIFLSLQNGQSSGTFSEQLHDSDTRLLNGVAREGYFISYQDCGLSESLDRAFFDDIIIRTTFIKNASAIWYPEMPTVRDTINVLYDSGSPFSRFQKPEKLTFFYHSYAADSEGSSSDFKRDMKKGRDGIYFLELLPGEIGAQGYFYFISSNNQVDNNFGSPWKLAVVDKKPEYRTSESRYFIYHWLGEDMRTTAEIRKIQKKADSGMKKIITLTGLAFEKKPDYYFYHKRELLLKYQALQGNNFEEFRNRVLEYQNPSDLHEAVHLLFQQLGRHVGLMDEGVAVYFGQEIPADGWRGRSCDSWAKEFLGGGKLPKLESIATPREFFTPPDPSDSDSFLAINYPVAGSFVRFLYNTYGMKKLKRIFSCIDNQCSADRISILFNECYSKDLSELESEWRHHLEQ